MSTDVREKILQAMSNELPEYFKVSQQQILSQKTIANLIWRGMGPPLVKINNINYLERTSFMNWVDARDGAKRGRKRKAV